jgi:hypothetical protein
MSPRVATLAEKLTARAQQTPAGIVDPALRLSEARVCDATTSVSSPRASLPTLA